jgi:hypothetical protein
MAAHPITTCYTGLQAKCSHASDVLRPYSALDYAWDEPGLPHTLLVELPGSRSLGAFDLDKVTCAAADNGAVQAMLMFSRCLCGLLTKTADLTAGGRQHPGGAAGQCAAGRG